VAEIAEANAEQLRGIEQVTQAMAQMDNVVQQNAALVEQSAAAAENLAGHAELMAHAVGRFKVEAAPVALAREEERPPAAVPQPVAAPTPLRRAETLPRGASPEALAEEWKEF